MRSTELVHVFLWKCCFDHSLLSSWEASIRLENHVGMDLRALSVLPLKHHLDVTDGFECLSCPWAVSNVSACLWVCLSCITPLGHQSLCIVVPFRCVLAQTDLWVLWVTTNCLTRSSQILVWTRVRLSWHILLRVVLRRIVKASLVRIFLFRASLHAWISRPYHFSPHCGWIMWACQSMHWLCVWMESVKQVTSWQLSQIWLPFEQIRSWWIYRR